MKASAQNCLPLVSDTDLDSHEHTSGDLDLDAAVRRYQHDPVALRQLVKSNLLLHEFVEQCPNAMCVYDQDGSLLAANAAYKRVHPKLPHLIKERGLHNVTFTEVARAQLAERLSGQELEEGVKEALDAFDSAEIMVTERDYGNNGFYRFTQFPLSDGAMARLAVEISAERRREHELLQARNAAEDASRQAEAALATERARKREARLLSELGEWLQSCKSLTELYVVIEQFMARFFPDSQGELYLYSNSRDVLDGACHWPVDSPMHDYIHADDCWSLRRGRTYKYGSGLVDFLCPHAHAIGEKYKRSICVPLIAQGDTVGMFHIRFVGEEHEAPENKQPEDDAFALRCSEQISLAIANVRLRDELKEQSTRDPLTGLYNRRFFSDRCRAELNIARSGGSRVALLAMDADHFKRFNDNHGHDAGDTVLRAIAEVMTRLFNGSEIVARLGGEEFAILLPNTTVSAVEERAEEFRKNIEALSVRYSEQALPRLTLSIGIAIYPDHGSDPQELLESADRALYDAKNAGRNCIRIASVTDIR